MPSVPDRCVSASSKLAALIASIICRRNAVIRSSNWSRSLAWFRKASTAVSESAPKMFGQLILVGVVNGKLFFKRPALLQLSFEIRLLVRPQLGGAARGFVTLAEAFDLVVNLVNLVNLVNREVYDALSLPRIEFVTGSVHGAISKMAL